MIITKMSLPRRTFLRGVGATIALPLLDAMVPALTASAKTAATVVPRLGFIYVPNGLQMENFVPKTDGTDFELTPILQPLAPFRSQLTVVSGLANAQADPLDLGGGPHTRCCSTWLSGTRPKRTEGADIEAGTTVDQLAAQEIGRDTPLRSLELAVEPSFTGGSCESLYSCAYINTTSWRSPTMPLPMETNPRLVFDRLFGDEGSTAARAAQMRKDRSILDAITEEMARLNKRLGARDATMVSDYLEAVREVEQRLQRISERADTSPIPDAPLEIPEGFEERAKLMFDLQLLAYQADITRVAAFQMARELSVRSYPNIGVAEAHHDVSHHGNAPEKMFKNTKINIYHVQIFTYFLERMQSTLDGDGSLLDHTILLYGGGMGNGNLHRPHDLPVILVGGGSGQLKGGRHLRVPQETPMMNLGLSLLDKVGVELPRIGDSTGRLAGL